MATNYTLSSFEFPKDKFYTIEKRRRIRKIDDNAQDYSSNTINYTLNLESDAGYLNPKGSNVELPMVSKVSCFTTNDTQQAFGAGSTGFVSPKNSGLDFINAISIKYNDNSIVSFQDNFQMQAHFNALSSWTNEALEKKGSIMNFYKNTEMGYETSASTSGIGETVCYYGMERQNKAFDEKRKAFTLLESTEDGLYNNVTNVAKLKTNYVETKNNTQYYYMNLVIPLTSLPFFNELEIVKGGRFDISIQFHTSTVRIPYTAANDELGVPIVSSQYGYNPIVVAPEFVSAADGYITIETQLGTGNIKSSYINYEMLDLNYDLTKILIAKHSLNKKLIRYQDYIYKRFTDWGSGETIMINNNISKLSGLLIVAQLGNTINGKNNLTSSGTGTAFSVMLSPYHNSLCSKHLSFNQLNVMLDSNPIYPRDIDYNYDMYLQMINSRSLNGGLNDQYSSGLITYEDWRNGGYGFLWFDFSGDMGSNPATYNSSHTLEFKAVNNTLIDKLNLHTFTFYDKSITINCETGEVDKDKIDA